MPLTIPAELKKITPYVRRAEELDKDKTNAESRLVAYYCRQYAVHVGISLATSVTGKTCLGELLSDLEQEKVAMNQFTREEAKFLCRMFANKIFDKADNEDRAGEASKTTAKTFYAAASFLEILMQFYKEGDDGDDAEEVSEIKKRAVYGKWKATEILKAIKEGRRPSPGGYGEDEPVAQEDDDEIGIVPTSNVDEPEQPTVVTVREDEEEAQSQPEGPLIRIPSAEDNDDLNLAPPPPAYDFAPPPMPPPAAPAPAPRPPMTMAPPPPKPTFVAAAPVNPMPAPPAKKGIFGFGNKNKAKLSKADYADAEELTKFAMAAMEDKDSDLAAERLAQALEILNRNK